MCNNYGKNTTHFDHFHFWQLVVRQKRSYFERPENEIILYLFTNFLFLSNLCWPVNRFPERKRQPKFDLNLLNFLKLNYAQISIQKAPQTTKGVCVNEFSTFQLLLTFKEVTEISFAAVNILKPSKESLGRQEWRQQSTYHSHATCARTRPTNQRQ